jgi:CO/xanthine dehydrogenase Mo-binding subunit
MFGDLRSGETKVIGKRTPRVDSIEKLTGEAIFVSDMALPGMLFAQVKKSPHARARILHIDELDYRIGLYMVDKYILAKGEVRHYGEAVAAVAADTTAIALQAVDLIHVEYEKLPPVLHPLDAIREDAPLVHPQLGNYDYMDTAFSPIPGTNICNHTKLRKGDIEAAFKRSEWILEREYTNPSVQHCFLET